MKLNSSKSLWLSLALSLLIAVAASISLFTNRGFSFHDETQIANLYEYQKIIGQGQFPPRWSPDVHFNYGSPYPQFNYQIPYFVSLIFKSFGTSLLDAYKSGLAVSVFLGSVGAFILGMNFGGPMLALSASVLYTLIPYRAIDIYVRGTIGESFALGLLPWVVVSLLWLLKKQSLKNVVFASVAISILLLSHQPTSAIALPFVFVFFIAQSMFEKKFKPFVKSLIFVLVTTFCLSAYYLIPLFMEMRYIEPVLPFNFYDHFPFLKQLIYSPWGYGSSQPGQYDDMSFQAGFPSLFVFLVAILVFLKTFLFSRKKSTTLGLILVLVVVNIFLMNIRSTFMWQIFPFTDSIQFPWRLLSLLALFTLILFVYLMPLVREKHQKLFAVVVMLGSVFVNLQYFHPGTIIDRNDQYYLHRYLPNQALRPGEKVSSEYLDYTENYMPIPVNSTRPKALPISKVTSILNTTQIVMDISTPFKGRAIINSPTGDMVTIHNFYFPGWVVKLNGQIVDVLRGGNGAMSLWVNRGNHILEFYYKDTLVRQISDLISLLSWLVFIPLVLYYLPKKSVK